MPKYTIYTLFLLLYVFLLVLSVFVGFKFISEVMRVEEILRLCGSLKLAQKAQKHLTRTNRTKYHSLRRDKDEGMKQNKRSQGSRGRHGWTVVGPIDCGDCLWQPLSPDYLFSSRLFRFLQIFVVNLCIKAGFWLLERHTLSPFSIIFSIRVSLDKMRERERERERANWRWKM